MTEGTELPPQPNSSPGSPIRTGLLILGILLLAILAVFALIYRQDLLPDFLLPPTPAPTLTPPSGTESPGPPSQGYLTLVHILTYGPPTATSTEAGAPTNTLEPGSELSSEPGTTTPPETATLAAPLLRSPTPALDSCQYQIKEGEADFLYSIYWSWGIHAQIPSADAFYNRITCAALISNLKCNYQASDPDLTQPGWVLVLPGVNETVCQAHGGTPVQ